MRQRAVIGLAAALGACNGGAGDYGRRAVEQSRIQARAASTPTVHVSAATPRDDSPTLVTVTGRANAATAPMRAAPTGATVPSGGYIVRGTTAAPSPSYASAPAAEAAPMARSATGHSSGYRFSDSAVSGDLARPATSSPSHRRESAARSGTAVADMAGSAGLGVSGGGGGGTAHGFGRGAVSAPAPMPRATTAPAGAPVTVTIAVGPGGAAPPIVPTDAADDEQASAGVLTAASVGDADRRANYVDYLQRHAGEASDLGLDMSRRVRFRVLDAQGHPVDDAQVSLSGDGMQFVGRTHADGSLDFFPSLAARHFSGPMAVRADVESVTARGEVTVPAVGDVPGTVVLTLPAIVAPPAPVLDLGFVIDVTGSMGDELSYVDREIASIVRRVEASDQGLRVRVSATLYRDRVDELVVQQIPFSTNVLGFANAMQVVNAGGGGDYPEDMNAGLDAAMNRLSWSDGPAVRVMVLIADAPPQPYGDERFTYRETMQRAAERGIRILPVAASGADRTVEYLFRAMGAMTSTPYVYLTDDSGVGAAHMEADTDRVAVERFDDLLVRMLVSDLHGEGMHEPGPLGAEG